MPRPRVSAQIAVVAIAAAVIGLLAATFVTTGIAGATGAFQFIPARIWVVAPAVWGFLGAAIGLVALPLMRRWGGGFVAAAVTPTFLAIRLRGHVALLLVLLAVGAALFIVARGWMQRWLARPRRA